jgi:hypothetical protein
MIDSFLCQASVIFGDLISTAVVLSLEEVGDWIWLLRDFNFGLLETR